MSPEVIEQEPKKRKHWSLDSVIDPVPEVVEITKGEAKVPEGEEDVNVTMPVGEEPEVVAVHVVVDPVDAEVGVHFIEVVVGCSK